MTIISLVSCSGAPGVTTVALATTAALTATDVAEPVMVELATSGGVIASQYDLPPEPGLTSLALDVGGDEVDLLDHAQELPGGLPVVVASVSGSKTTKLLGARANQLADYLQAAPETVVVDGGRVAADTPLLPILERSRLIGIVVRPSREGFHLAATTLAELEDTTDVPLPLGWVIVGPCPWSTDDVIDQYGLPVLSSIANDRQGAEAVAGLRKLRRHAPLARSAQSFADDLAKHIRVSSDDAPLGYLEDLHPVDDDHPDSEETSTPVDADPAGDDGHTDDRDRSVVEDETESQVSA